MKIVNFRKVVTEYTTGAIGRSKLGYYAKRLSKETAVRRIGAALMVGLLVFQIFTFVLPPQTTNAASDNDMIKGGIGGSKPEQADEATMKANLNAVLCDSNFSLGNLFYSQFGFSCNNLGGLSQATLKKSEWTYSFGHNAFSGSQPLCTVPDLSQLASCINNTTDTSIYVGSPSTRWGANITQFNGLQLNSPVQIGSKWWKVGIIAECGNLVLTPTTPPPGPEIEVSKEVVNGPGAPVKPGDTLTYRVHFKTKTNVGFSQSQNNNEPFRIADVIPHNTTYVPGSQTTDLPIGLPPNNGVRAKEARFNQPESQNQGRVQLNWAYDQILAGYDFYAEFKATVNANVANTTQICNFGVYSFSPQFPIVTNTVCNPVNNAQNLRCESVNTGGKTTFAIGENVPVNGFARQVSGDVGAINFQYILVAADFLAKPTSNRVTDANGNTQYSVSNVAPAANNQYTSNLPSANAVGAPGSASAKQPKFDKAGEYGIFLRVVRVADPTNVSDAFSVPGCFVKITVPPPTQPSFICKSLTVATNNAQPGKPVEATFIATAQKSSDVIKITGYNFNFGDNSAAQNVASDQLSVNTKHTYAQAGKYKAKVTVAATGGTSTQATCEVDVDITSTKFTKQVSNLTLLTSDGKPTDANNQVARAGDTLKYQIAVCNDSTETLKGFVYEDDITDILYYADVKDLGGGELIKTNSNTKIKWAPVDIAPVGSGQKCLNADGTINAAAFAKSFKEFTVVIKNPLPAVASKATDTGGYDCQIQDEFKGNIVVTPVGVPPAKQVECAVTKLPQTGAGAPIFFIAFFAASSLYLFFRNRLLKRELKLVDTLDEGGGNARK